MKGSLHKESHTKLSLKRWGWILLYTLAGLVMAPALSSLLHKILGVLFYTETAVYSDTVAFYFKYGVLLLLLWVALKQSRVRLGHFRYLLRYPPSLVAVPIAFVFAGSAVLCFGIEGMDAVSSQYIGNRFTFFGVFLAFTTLLAGTGAERMANKTRALSPKKNAPRLGDAEHIRNMPFEDIEAWLKSEAPIEDENNDMFNAGSRARRVWRAIATKRPNLRGLDLRQTAVIQGPFGSGKSSVVQLIEQYAAKAIESGESNETHIFVKVNCWGFSSATAQEQLLARVIEELSKRVDCLALRGLPSEYLAAINASNKWLGMLVGALGSPGTPEQQLRRLTPLLRCLKAVLVIVIEDTDRNGAEFDQKHIEAMLHRFREVELVSFILTAGNKSDIDFAKIADHILFLTPPKEDIVLALLDRVRNHCLACGEIIDPLAGQRKSTLLTSAAVADMAQMIRGERHPTWISGITEILNTPRSLKKVMDSVITGWRNLKGEVDLDELMMINTLRLQATEAFNFFGSHYQEFKILAPNERLDKQDTDRSKKRGERRDFLKQRWLRACELSGHDDILLAKLLAELGYASTHITGIEAWDVKNRCQSVNSARGNVYFDRLTAEDMLGNELRDQEVLQLRATATSEETLTALGKRFASSVEFADLFVFFEKYHREFRFESALPLASIILNELHPFGDYNREDQTYIRLRIWLEQLNFENEPYFEWLANEIEKCIPKHLPDAIRLFHEMRHGHGDSKDTIVLRNRLVNAVKTAFANLGAAEITQCFLPEYIWSLAHLIRIDGKAYPPEFLTNPGDWAWLAPKIIDAMREHRSTFMPQVMVLFGKYGPGGGLPTFWEYDENAMRTFFGSRYREALELLAIETEFPKAQGEFFQQAAELGFKEAQKLLEADRSSQSDESALPAEVVTPE